MTEKKVVAVVGAGLVGSLEACCLAQRGHEVHVYEFRDDIRTLEHVPGRSINLAMSVRGLSSLKEVGIAEHVRDEYGIQMFARMIHNKDGQTFPIPYGKENQCIYSVGRRYINEVLLDKGDSYPNITYHFNHKLIKADLAKPQLVFQKTNETNPDKAQVVVDPDLIIGCDGAYSAVRKEMMKKPRFNYSQEYIPHAYMELCILPINDDFAMPPNYLHIWPRGQFMMIGLPNQDKSFTVTLFMPTETFDSIQNRTDLLEFFKENFADSIPLIGEEKLVNDYFTNRALPLVSIKCFPYHVGSTSVILGDAAHAMVPFYGQGMNCGMEDCLVLNRYLDKYGNDIGKALEGYSLERNKDAEAMCDLAMYNYIEMRDLVNRKSFLVRKKIDGLLYYLFPNWWVPLYTSVTFSRMRYHQCIENKAWQDTALTKISGVAGLVSMAAIYLVARERASRDFMQDMICKAVAYFPQVKALLNIA